MRLYKVRFSVEAIIIVAAENIVEANHGKWLVGECLESGLNHRIVSVESYDGPSILKDELDAL